MTCLCLAPITGWGEDGYFKMLRTTDASDPESNQDAGYKGGPSVHIKTRSIL